jgi:hypothetical protein
MKGEGGYGSDRPWDRDDSGDEARDDAPPGPGYDTETGEYEAGAEAGAERPGFARRNRGPLLAFVLIVAAFLGGFVWQFLRAEQAAEELERTRTALEFSRMEATLAAAAVEAQRGHYESSRVLTSDFYRALQDRITGAPEAARDELRAVQAQRDEAITLLSRASPASAELMAELLTLYRVGIRGPQHALPLPGTDQPAPQP